MMKLYSVEKLAGSCLVDDFSPLFEKNERVVGFGHMTKFDIQSLVGIMYEQHHSRYEPGKGTKEVRKS